MVLNGLTPEEQKMLSCLVENKRHTMDSLQSPSNLFATNAPPLVFGAAYFHSMMKPNAWPESLRKGGIHRTKVFVAGAVVSLIGPIIHRLVISSKILKESLVSHGYNFPPTNEERALISKMLKHIKEDPENASATKIESSPLSYAQNAPVQSSKFQDQVPPLVESSSTPTQNVYENQDNSQNNQNPYSYNSYQSGNSNFNRWTDNPQSSNFEEDKNKPKQYKSWDDYGK